MKWQQIKATVDVKDRETACAVMSMVEQSLMIEDYSDVTEGMNAMYGELLDDSLVNADKSKVGVSIFLSEDKNVAESLEYLRHRFAESSVDARLEVSGVDEKDWENSWKQYYRPVRCGVHALVVPSWIKVKTDPDDVVVYMDPGMAFGAGTHETTRLCISMMEKHMEKDVDVMDMGTGSGILAIYAAKNGARHVDAYDIDPVAVRVAEDNVRTNGVGDRIDVAVSDLLAGAENSRAKKYDFICANIVADIVIRFAEKMGDYLKEGGLVAASGIINTQRDRVIKAVESRGFTLVDEMRENDWCSFLFKK